MKLKEAPDVATSSERPVRDLSGNLKARGLSLPVKRVGKFMLPTPSQNPPTQRNFQAKLTPVPLFARIRNQPPTVFKRPIEQEVRFNDTADDELLGQAKGIVATLIKMAYGKLQEAAITQYEEMVDVLITKPVVTPLIMRKAMMEAQAKEAVMQSGHYLTSQQLAEVAGLSPTNPSAQPNKWKSAGRIFAVNFKGTDYYPDFGLDPEDNYRPYDGLKPILEVFSDKKSPWKIAFWFQSPNGTLNFRAPQDVIQEDPKLVLAAALDEVQGVQHG